MSDGSVLDMLKPSPDADLVSKSQMHGVEVVKTDENRTEPEQVLLEAGTAGFASAETWSESVELGDRNWPRGHQKHHP
ncbi:hypothetical protein QR685DRAFT_496893 [Neurospora intermedia]|uniref:Uncharacterized protein n=1 Tax=Neurospora intermedia TaxID=5142 RepID=A0ABR3DCI6_NEUIN